MKQGGSFFSSELSQREELPAGSDDILTDEKNSNALIRAQIITGEV